MWWWFSILASQGQNYLRVLDVVLEQFVLSNVISPDACMQLRLVLLYSPCAQKVAERVGGEQFSQ